MLICTLLTCCVHAVWSKDAVWSNLTRYKKCFFSTVRMLSKGVSEALTFINFTGLQNQKLAGNIVND